MWKTINQTYATTAAKNCWANLAGMGWRKVKPTTDSGVTNTHLLLSLANANGKQAYVTLDSSNLITAVYL